MEHLSKENHETIPVILEVSQSKDYSELEKAIILALLHTECECLQRLMCELSVIANEEDALHAIWNLSKKGVFSIDWAGGTITISVCNYLKEIPIILTLQ